MPAPATYDDPGGVFQIDPTAMFGYATVDLPDEVKALVASIEHIFSIWQGLRLAWVGTSADDAQDFSDRMNTNLKQLFGTSDDAASGVLPKIAKCIGVASINFGVCEDTVMKMFDSLTNGLNAPASGNSPPHRGLNDGPITENTP